LADQQSAASPNAQYFGPSRRTKCNKTTPLGVNHLGRQRSKEVVMRLRAPLLLSSILFAGVTLAQTPVDIQEAKQLKRTNTLGSCSYTPTNNEKPFLDRVPRDEQVTGSAFDKEPFRIQGKKGKYVSWFGVVRGISLAEPGAKQYRLLLEQK
jgi:hypothetical protein